MNTVSSRRADKIQSLDIAPREEWPIRRQCEWQGQVGDYHRIVFRDSRFFAALSLAHSTVATFCSYPRLLVFTDINRFSKNGEVQTRHQNPPCVGSPCHRESELVVSGGNHQYVVRVAGCECVG